MHRHHQITLNPHKSNAIQENTATTTNLLAVATNAKAVANLQAVPDFCERVSCHNTPGVTPPSPLAFHRATAWVAGLPLTVVVVLASWVAVESTGADARTHSPGNPLGH